MNGSFDQEPENPVAWIEGATEPRKALAISLAGEQKAHGKQSLKLQLNRDGRGGLIQRIAVDPGKKYRLTAALATRDLVGEAYVGFFPTTFTRECALMEWRDVDTPKASRHPFIEYSRLEKTVMGTFGSERLGKMLGTVPGDTTVSR